MLIRADARQLPLRDRCVQCVVTSPPYFGLRDYGTARWEGGDPNCDHTAIRRGHGTHEKQATSAGTSRDPIRGEDCRLCGAERIDSQIGLESTPDAYVQTLVTVFREVRRVLTDDGVCWVNLGDSYAQASARAGQNNSAHEYGHTNTAFRKERYSGGANISATVVGLKPKDLLGIPWRVAFALQADGWYLRSDIIWAKPNPMPESVTDRPTKAHEYVFLLSKCERYYYDAAAIAEQSIYAGKVVTLGEKSLSRGQATGANVQASGNGLADSVMVRDLRNRRTVWTIPTMPYSGAHFATMPEKLVEPCILAGSRLGDRVFDPFLGSGTVGAVAERVSRRWIGIDLNSAYHALAKHRTAQLGFRFDELDESSLGGSI